MKPAVRNVIAGFPKAFMVTPIRAVTVALVIALMVGCKAKPDPAHLFPLQVGLQWTYQQTTAFEQRTEKSEFVVSNAASVSINNVPTTERINSLGNRYYIAETAQGIYRAAARNELDDAPIADKEASVRFVLKQPFALGTTWQINSYPFMLQRFATWPYEMRYGKPFVMDFEVVNAAASIEVPAGSFQGCLQVQGKYLMRLLADPTKGYEDFLISQLEWYCPGTGLVKLVRDEPIYSKVYQGGRYTLELTKFSGS
jgi:hypothetical protein